MKYQGEDLKRLLYLAESGASSYQCFLASAIIADNGYPQRVVEACKWAIIANFLSDPMAKPIVEFLQLGMSDAELEEAFKLAENWIEQKAFANDSKKTSDTLD